MNISKLGDSMKHNHEWYWLIDLLLYLLIDWLLYWLVDWLELVVFVLMLEFGLSIIMFAFVMTALFSKAKVIQDPQKYMIVRYWDVQKRSKWSIYYPVHIIMGESETLCRIFHFLFCRVKNCLQYIQFSKACQSSTHHVMAKLSWF